MRTCAPAVVMLATVVNAAAAEPIAQAQAVTPDLSWVVRGGAAHSAQSTRVLLAKKAVKAIHSLDRQCSARAEFASQDVPRFPAWAPARACECPAQQPACGSHQHSAP